MAEVVKICDLRSGMRAITVTFILLERRREPFRTDAGSTIHLWLVADETGSIDLALYDAHGDAFRGGDIVCLTNGYCSIHRNALQLGVGPGKPRRIGEITMRYVEEPYMSAPHRVHDQQQAQPQQPMQPQQSLRPQPQLPQPQPVAAALGPPQQHQPGPYHCN